MKILKVKQTKANGKPPVRSLAGDDDKENLIDQSLAALEKIEEDVRGWVKMGARSMRKPANEYKEEVRKSLSVLRGNAVKSGFLVDPAKFDNKAKEILAMVK